MINNDSYLSPQFKYMIFRIFICIHRLLRVYYEFNSRCDQLPVGLIAQSVEHCTGIAEAIGPNPVLAFFFVFSGFNFTTAQVVCITAMINHNFHIFLRSSNI